MTITTFTLTKADLRCHCHLLSTNVIAIVLNIVISSPINENGFKLRIICFCKSSSFIFPPTRSLQSSYKNLQNLAFTVTLDCNMPIFFFGTFYTQHVTGNYKKTVTVTHLDRTGITNELGMEYFGLSHDLDIITNRVYNINGVCVFQADSAPMVSFPFEFCF